MPKHKISERERTLLKRERNRVDYLALKGKQEPALIRLGVGERQILDQAAANAGLSRSAFAQLYLIPIASALSAERIQALAQLTAAKRIALSTAIGNLIDSYTANGDQTISTGAPEDVSSAFDALFDVARPSEDGGVPPNE